MPHPAAPAVVWLTPRATEATVRVPPVMARAAAMRPIRPRTLNRKPDMAPAPLFGAPPHALTVHVRAVRHSCWGVASGPAQPSRQCASHFDEHRFRLQVGRPVFEAAGYMPGAPVSAIVRPGKIVSKVLEKLSVGDAARTAPSEGQIVSCRVTQRYRTGNALHVGYGQLSCLRLPFWLRRLSESYADPGQCLIPKSESDSQLMGERRREHSGRGEEV